jgi:hybrid cluster-associated redox disulfide protein
MRQAAPPAPHCAATGLTVAELLERWPHCSAVFLRHRLACVGCMMSHFEQVEDVPSIYGLDGPAFMEELCRAIEGVTAEQPGG